MILPSDSDLPPDRNDGSTPGGQSDSDPTWWEDPNGAADDADESGEEDLSYFGDSDDPEELPALASIAGPGWRKDLYKDILESLRDLEAIEDPDDEFAPPEPPDLYTFFGELAALRTELRHQGQRANDSLNQLGKSLVPLLRATPAGKSGPSSSTAESPDTASQPSGSWPPETCLALISAWDLLPQATSAAAFEASLLPLLKAAGLTRIPTTGFPFDPATMTLSGTEKAPRKSAGLVLRETSAGFLRAGTLLRPAGVIAGA